MPNWGMKLEVNRKKIRRSSTTSAMPARLKDVSGSREGEKSSAMGCGGR
jgi:hypothetical protein